MAKFKTNEEEQELIEAIRNVQKSKHNPSVELKRYARELFERLLNK